MSQPIDIEVNKADFANINKVLRKMNADNMHAFLTDVGRRLVNDFRMGFRQSLAPDNTPWAPITHRNGKPLLDTARLRNSITSRVNGKQVEVGTNVEYAKAQQYGGGTIQVPTHTKMINQAFGKPLKYPVYVKVKAHTQNTNIKLRPFLDIKQRQIKKIIKAFEVHLNKLSNGEVTQ